jgi:flagellar basal body rod protein FlgG
MKFLRATLLLFASITAFTTSAAPDSFPEVKNLPVQTNLPDVMTMANGGFFRADSAQAQPKAATATGVRQGFVEASNTSPTLAMASLITSMRMFETNQKVMLMQSDRMSKAITELSRTT